MDVCPPIFTRREARYLPPAWLVTSLQVGIRLTLKTSLPQELASWAVGNPLVARSCPVQAPSRVRSAQDLLTRSVLETTQSGPPWNSFDLQPATGFREFAQSDLRRATLGLRSAFDLRILSVYSRLLRIHYTNPLSFVLSILFMRPEGLWQLPKQHRYCFYRYTHFLSQTGPPPQ